MHHLLYLHNICGSVSVVLNHEPQDKCVKYDLYLQIFQIPAPASIDK